MSGGSRGYIAFWFFTVGFFIGVFCHSSGLLQRVEVRAMNAALKIDCRTVDISGCSTTMIDCRTVQP
jgi:hypothetical protein